MSSSMIDNKIQEHFINSIVWHIYLHLQRVNESINIVKTKLKFCFQLDNKKDQNFYRQQEKIHLKIQWINNKQKNIFYNFLNCRYGQRVLGKYDRKHSRKKTIIIFIQIQSVPKQNSFTKTSLFSWLDHLSFRVSKEY